jgi:hypothetical protein
MAMVQKEKNEDLGCQLLVLAGKQVMQTSAKSFWDSI